MKQLVFVTVALSVLCVTAVADRDVPRVGVYRPAALEADLYGANGIYEALVEAEGMEVALLLGFDPQQMKRFDVIVLSGVHELPDTERLRPYREILRKYVELGGSVLLAHASCGYPGFPKRPFADPLFPEVLHAPGRMDSFEMIPEAIDHSVLNGLKGPIRHGYCDHLQLAAGPSGTVLARDAQGKPTVVAGSFGRGRVVGMGNPVGYASIKQELKSYPGEDRKPEGGERALLVNALRWLGGADSSRLRSPEGFAALKEVAGMKAPRPGQRGAS